MALCPTLRLFVTAAAVVLAGCSSPCSAPITYKLGKLDEGFAMNRVEVLSAIARAEAIWEKALGRDLFRFEEQDGELAVNFLYDARQMIAQENERRQRDIEDTGSSADEVKSRYDQTTAKYEAAKNDFLARQTAQDARVAAHNRSIEAWNARGGAPPRELDAIEREETALEASAASVEEARVAVNELAERANALSARYNRLAREVNANVAAINTTAGREFKQGHFVRDARGIRIDVYEYLDRDDLVHVLAHELGHALGVDHNDNPASIMYGLNSSQSLELSSEDKAAAQRRCGGQVVIEKPS